MSKPEASLLQIRSLIERGNIEQGWELLARSLSLHPDHAGLHNFAGAMFQRSSQLQQALQHLARAVELDPELADAWHNLALLNHQLARDDDAQHCFREALRRAPDNAQILFNLSFSQEQAGEAGAAVETLGRALEVEPGHLEARYRWMYLKRFACDWSGLDKEAADLEIAIQRHVDEKGSSRVSPYGLNIHKVSAGCHDACAAYLAYQVEETVVLLAERCAASPDLAVASSRADTKIRVAYLSADFCSHAVGGLVHQLFEHHDRDRFHVTAYALTEQDDAINQAIRQGVDDYQDLSAADAVQAHDVIAEDGIDILVDLGGYTKGARPEIMALRPAPVQISWLGYLNTMRADFIDYVLADEIVVPQGDDAQYSESVIRLPGCFLPASTFPAEPPMQKTDTGLPEDKTVFCSFNHAYKIEPDAFDAWMEILQEVTESILWLYAGASEDAEQKLSAAAIARGIDADRLVFAPRVPLNKHLSRLSAADLFLDTFYYNAGATGIATTQACVPILTMSSGRILGRMGASINNALGVNELTCGNVEDYIRTAIKLAQNPDQLLDLKSRIEDTKPALFDLKQFARKLESSFEKTLELSSG